MDGPQALTTHTRLNQVLPFVAAGLGAVFMPTAALPLMALLVVAAALLRPNPARLALLGALSLATVSGLRGLWTPWSSAGWIIPTLQGLVLIPGFVLSIREHGLKAGPYPASLRLALWLMLPLALAISWVLFPGARPYLSLPPDGIPPLWTEIPIPRPDATGTLFLPALWLFLLFHLSRSIPMPLKRIHGLWRLPLLLPVILSVQAFFAWQEIPDESTACEDLSGMESATELENDLRSFQRAGWLGASRETLLRLARWERWHHGPGAGRGASWQAAELSGTDLAFRVLLWSDLYWSGERSKAWAMVDEHGAESLAALRPCDADAALLISRALQRKGRQAEAATVLEKAARVPDSLEALALDRLEKPREGFSYGEIRAQQAALEQARMLAVSDSMDKARAIAQNFLKLDPDFPPALTVMGLALMKEGDKDAALRYVAKGYQRGDTNDLWIGGTLAAVSAWNEDETTVKVVQEALPRRYDPTQWLGAEKPTLFVPGSRWMELPLVGGYTQVRMEVKADVADDQGPILHLLHNGKEIDTREITNETWGFVDFVFEATWGINELRVRYDNDVAPEGQDRNLYLRNLWVRPKFKLGERR